MKKIDYFVAVNTALFLVLCVFRYYARFIQYRGAEHIEEFFIYAVVILCGIFVLWRVFRHYPFDAVILILLQVGIVMHFSGAFVLIEGGRLYDASILGIRYDKYVHFVNSFGAALLVSRLFQIQRIPITRVNSIFLLMVVLGLGAVIEIVEYMVVLTVPNNGVGGYDNNMQDLMSNLCGGIGFLLWRHTLGRRANTQMVLLRGTAVGPSVEPATATLKSDAI